MVLTRMEHKGGAVATTLTSTITNVSLSITIDSATGWPTGGANGKFVITIDRDLPTEERILVQSRTGNVLTIAGTGDRGVDGTTATGHTGGVATVEHTFSGIEADDANRHITVTTDDDHTQYMRTDGTRHDLTGRHTYGAALGARPLPVATGTVLSAGVAAAPAAGDHVHTHGVGSINNGNQFAAGVVPAGALAPGAINNSNQFAASVVDANAIGPDAVGSSEIAPGAVGTSELNAAVYGGAPPAIADTGSAGAATTVSRSDHTHADIMPDAVSSTQNGTYTFTNTSFGVAGSGGYVDCGVAFVAPPSGRVRLDWAGWISNSSSSFAIISPVTRNGAVVGSGTVFKAADDDYSISQGNEAGRVGAHDFLSGLTPGNSYNVRLEHRVPANTGTALRRIVTVTPLP